MCIGDLRGETCTRMAPSAEDVERGERGAGCAGGAGGARVTPAGPGAAAAWTEADTSRLLDPARPHDSITLAVWPALDQPPPKYTPPQKIEKLPVKTKYQKRKEKLVAALRPPYFILSMVVIITGVHAYGSDEVRAALEWAPGSWRREPWRLVSYGWVHASAAHVALNALVALAVGWRLEREQGWWRAAALWTAGVLAGALGAALCQPRVRVVGASAAVYALLTAHIPNVCLRFGHIPLWWFRPLSVVVLAASEAAWAAVRTPDDAPAHLAHHDQVAWAAHVFGAAIGVPLAFLVFTGENIEKRSVAWCRAVSLALLAAAAGAAALYTLHCSRV